MNPYIKCPLIIKKYSKLSEIYSETNIFNHTHVKSTILLL